MHDHALQFKADLDIAGVNNTMVKHEFKAADVDYKWSNVTRSTMKLVRSELSNEDDSKMVSSLRGQSQSGEMLRSRTGRIIARNKS
jgi:primary-amine oxidase